MTLAAWGKGGGGGEAEEGVKKVVRGVGVSTLILPNTNACC